MKNKKFNWDWVTIVFLALAFCIFLKGTFDLKNWSSRYFPLMVLGLVAILTTMMIINAICKPAPEYNFRGGARALFIAGSLLAYILVIYVVGFYIASPIYMGVTMYLLGMRNKKVLFIVPIAVTLFIYVTFDIIMKIPVPMGLLFK